MIRADLADELKHWLGYVLTALQGEALRRGEPICPTAWQLAPHCVRALQNFIHNTRANRNHIVRFATGVEVRTPAGRVPRLRRDSRVGLLGRRLDRSRKSHESLVSMDHRGDHCGLVSPRPGTSVRSTGTCELRRWVALLERRCGRSRRGTSW